MSHNLRLLVVASICLLPALPAAYGNVLIAIPTDSPALRFGGEELSSALAETGKQTAVRVGRDGDITVRVARSAVRGGPEAFVVQRKGTRVEVTGGSSIGAMYGLLDVADSVRLGRSLDAVEARRARPFLPMRGIKWNMPFAGGAYAGGEGGGPGQWLWSRDFWEKFLTMMARSRYNVLTLWNGCPYHHLVRLDNIPEASDVPPEQIDANIAFFRWVTKRARDLGIRTYVITWNIHVSPSFAKERGIEAQGVDTPEVREYLRECVRALIDTYPDLTGIGTCPGERMRMTPQERQDFIADVYFGGMRRASRRVPFFLRYWQGDPHATARMLDRVKWPEPVYVSVKFNGEHMYSSPRFHLLDHNWLTMAKRRWKVFWHFRNDCIFRLKWADPDFVREAIQSCNAPYSCGFFWGSEGLKPGADASHRPAGAAYAKYDYEFERKAEMYRVWGRLSYDPDTPDEVLMLDYCRRYGRAGEDAFRALTQASRVIPLTTSFHWNYMNGDWRPEHNIGAWNTSHEQSIRNYRDQETFHSVKEYIFNATIDETLCNIPDFVAAEMNESALPKGQRSPIDAAQEILNAAQEANGLIASAREKLDGDDPDFACLEGDVRIAAELGRYYGWKILAAAHLGRLLVVGDRAAREPAVKLLTECADTWQRLTDLAAQQYPTRQWRDQLPQVAADIAYAKTVQPLPSRGRAWRVAAFDKPFETPDDVKQRVWNEAEARVFVEEGEAKGLGQWIARMNAALAHASIDLAKASGPPGAFGYLARTNYVAEADGIADLVVRTTCQGTVWLGTGAQRRSFDAGRPGVHFFSGAVNSGENLIQVMLFPGAAKRQARLALDVSVLPVHEIAARMECEKAQDLRPPMVVVKDPQCSGRACVHVPRNAGRGDDAEGNPIDHGCMLLPFSVERMGKYEVWVRVFWPATTANSYFIQVDEGAIVQFGQDEVFGRWHWVKARDTYSLAAGRHRLILRTRETDTRGDYVVIAPAR